MRLQEWHSSWQSPPYFPFIFLFLFFSQNNLGWKLFLETEDIKQHPQAKVLNKIIIFVFFISVLIVRNRRERNLASSNFWNYKKSWTCKKFLIHLKILSLLYGTTNYLWKNTHIFRPCIYLVVTFQTFRGLRDFTRFLPKK